MGSPIRMNQIVETAESHVPTNQPNCQMEDDVIIDLKAMLLDRKEPPLSTSCCIYRVPHVIREQNAATYTPTVVSIGPFHYGNPRLQYLEAHKQKYFQQFIERAQSSTILDELVMVVDALFIIELFLKWFSQNWSKDDAILQTTWFLHSIELDLSLFENQLPFFILEEFFNMSFPGQNQGHPSFLQLTFHFFTDCNTQDLKPSDLDVPIKHFTNLLRTFHLQPGHVLEIPEIFVHDKTEILFHNIIAFEQYRYPFEGHIADYLSFLDDLINTRKDVDALVHNNIIVNNLGDSNDVAKVFNGLCKNILVDDNHDYQDICKSLNEFYTDPWNKKKATLRSDYCRTPWQTAASIAGIFLIILSLVQAICSVLQVARQI